MKDKQFSIGLFAGLFLFLLVINLPTPEGLDKSAQFVAATAILMATWWISEALPFAITALLPVVLFPLFNVMGVNQITPAYSHQIIFLFLSGFIFALAIERWHLHKRFALRTIRIFGYSQSRILLGFMFATAFLSMWVSNTATTLMMTPIAIAVAKHLEGDPSSDGAARFSLSLLLGIAYSASIGGVATLIGTPPNAILAGILESQAGISIGFFEWMLFALPLAFCFLLFAWGYLALLMQRDSHPQIRKTELLSNELKKLNPLTYEEKWILVIFGSVCLLWIARGLVDIALFQSIKDSTIGILGAMILYIIPAKNNQQLMDWETTKKLPWEILILFGGGFALASGFEHTMLTHWLASRFSLFQGVDTYIIIFVIVLFVIFLTEITSNTATATLLIPIMIALSDSMQIPVLWLTAAVAIATSYAFMLPVATPPNAIVFSTGRVPIKKMAQVGFWLNIAGSILITVFILLVLPWVMGWEKGL